MAHAELHFIGRYIIVDGRENRTNFTRLGLTVTCRYGSAPERNRFKRLTREAFRLNYNKLKSGYDFNIKPRSAAKQACMGDIMSELLRFIGDHDKSRDFLTQS